MSHEWRVSRTGRVPGAYALKCKKVLVWLLNPLLLSCSNPQEQSVTGWYCHGQFGERTPLRLKHQQKPLASPKAAVQIIVHFFIAALGIMIDDCLLDVLDPFRTLGWASSSHGNRRRMA